MIGEILASGSLNIDFGNVLTNLQQAGFFSYIIPFLLIFALVFGILTKIQIFKDNKAIYAIIALAVALMALQFDVVPKFFAQIFPAMGVGISIVLVILILLGLFIDPDNPGLMWVLFGIAALIVIIVLSQTAGNLGLPVGSWLADNWQTLLIILVVVGGIVGAIAAIVHTPNPNRQPPKYRNLAFFPLDDQKRK